MPPFIFNKFLPIHDFHIPFTTCALLLILLLYLKLMMNSNYKLIIMNFSQSYYFPLPCSYNNSHKQPLNWTHYRKETLIKKQGVFSNILPGLLVTFFSLRDFYLDGNLVRFDTYIARRYFKFCI